MNRSASRNLGIALLAGICGHFLHVASLPIRRWCVHEAMERTIQQGVAHERTVVLRFHGTDRRSIDWLEQDEEFRHQGRMYDVISIHRYAERMEIVCVEDGEESWIMWVLEQTTHGKPTRPLPDPLLLLAGCPDNGSEAAWPPVPGMERTWITDRNGAFVRPRDPEAPPPRAKA